MWHLTGETGATAATRWEQQLVSRIRAGDQKAFADLFDQFSTTVYGVAVRIVGEPKAAESITTAVFLEVWRHPDAASANGNGGLRSGMATLSRAAAKQWRHTHPVQRGQANGSPGSAAKAHTSRPPNSAEAVEAEAMRSRTVACLTMLSGEERTVLEAVAFDGDTVVEIAARIGVPVNSAVAQLSDALRRLTALYNGDCIPKPRESVRR